jgi:hypothetical protein
MKSDNPIKRRMGSILGANHWPALLVGLVAAILYSRTLMVSISGCDHEYCLDAGEFQVALAVWGTVHPTGYPLYMLLGSPFVALLGSVGVPPAAGASAFSLVWAVATVVAIAVLMGRISNSPWLSLGGGLLLAVLRPFWVHGSIAEVYSLIMTLCTAALWLTITLRERWSDRRGWLLALVLGLGIAHHRLIALMTPMIVVYLFPVFYPNSHRWRWLAIATVCFLAGFLPYLDILVRAWAGSQWLYTQIRSWRDVWFMFSAGEYSNLLQPSAGSHSLLTKALAIAQSVAAELTWPGFAATAMGGIAAFMARRTRPFSLLCLGIAGAFFLFSLVFERTVFMEAVLMLPLALMLILLVTGAGLAPKPWPTILGLGLIGGATLLGIRNDPFVRSLTRDVSGLAYAAQMERLEAPQGAVVMAPWGKGYFALAYAQRVEGRMREWTIVDHRADFAALTRQTGRLYTAADTLYVCSVHDFWQPRLGQVHLASAGPGIVEIARQPLDLDRLGKPVTVLGDGVAIADVEVRSLGPGQVDVVVWWKALARPRQDYSSFVHAYGDETAILPDTVVGQSDQSAPVYGWRPTSGWIPGEIVREHHAITYSPSGPPPRLLRIGMYRQVEGGGFEHLGETHLVMVDGEWVRRK